MRRSARSEAKQSDHPCELRWDGARIESSEIAAALQGSYGASMAVDPGRDFEMIIFTLKKCSSK